MTGPAPGDGGPAGEDGAGGRGEGSGSEVVAEGAADCPVCGSSISGAVRVCGRCDTPHHAECWEYVGDCAIFGCRARPPGGNALPGAVSGGGAAGVGEGEGDGEVHGHLPASPAEHRLAEAASGIRIWAKLFRAQWWALVVTTVMAVAFMPMAAGMMRGGIASWLLEGFSLGLFAWLVLWGPVVATRKRLEATLEVKLTPPRHGLRRMLDHTEMTDREGPAMLVLDFLPLVYLGWCAWLWSIAPHWVSGAAFAVWTLLGVGTLMVLWAATRERLLFVDTVQNRLLASTKAKG